MNLILQHWAGEVSSLELASWDSIEKYARRIGSEHGLVLGEPMGVFAMLNLHKLHLFSKDYDGYDKVVMMDSDMFATPNAPDIFKARGIGVMGPTQLKLRAGLRAKLPELFTTLKEADFYGGALYKFNRYERMRFRAHLTPDVLKTFDSYERGVDEGAIHYMASRTGFVGHALPDGERWAMSSFDPGVASAHLIHVRRRITAGREERRDKIEALKELQAAGLVA